MAARFAEVDEALVVNTDGEVITRVLIRVLIGEPSGAEGSIFGALGF
ncbi:MAG: hypothetical protein HYX89_08305 [Chloroflexi bacterium]|nr:hypothetical protein [Chloroflexota bacterium]